MLIIQHLLLLEHQDGIGTQIGSINTLSLGLDLWMLLAQQPANVREEEATSSVVWISIGFRVLVMYTMIARPMVGGILEGDCIENNQNHTQWPLGLVRAMGPQTMCASRNTQTGDDVQSKSYKSEKKTGKL